MDQFVKIGAKFIRESDGEALSGRQYAAKLYDKDILVDDELGEVRLDREGSAQFLFDLANASSFDSLGEAYPDLYLVLYEDDQEIFRSKVFQDVDFLQEDPVTHELKQLTQDLGTFKI